MKEPVTTRPTVALVAHAIHDGGGMERAFFELVARSHREVRYVVVSAELDERLRGFVEWHRIRVPMRPILLKSACFALAAGLRLARTHSDLRHTLGAIVPNRVDVATVQFCAAGFRAASGRLAPPEMPLLRRTNTALFRLFSIGFERFVYRPKRLRALAPVSRGVAAELGCHYPEIRIEVTPNGVDVGRFTPDAAARASLRAELGVEDATFVALFVGGDWDRKGLEFAIDGLARAAVPSSELWVVGRGDEARFAARARAAGVGDRVRFVGPRHDTERWYAAADAFVFPTLYEAAPLVAYEAAAVGLPIVATAVNGIDELLEDSAGLPVTRDAAAVGAALAELATDPTLRTRLGLAGREHASGFGWDRSVESVLALYRSLGASS